MKKSIVYLCPQVQGEQDYVCWGMAQKDLTLAKKEAIKGLILAGLTQISTLNGYFSGRSFSVFLGEDEETYWVAVPKGISVKVMKILDLSLCESGLTLTRVVTSKKSPLNFLGELYPVISYDRGFVYDGSKIGTNKVGTSFMPARAANDN